MEIFFHITFVLYLCLSLCIFSYGLNCYWLLIVFMRNKKIQLKLDKEQLIEFYKNNGMKRLPKITTQIPVYNEINVIERVIDSVCSMNYPKNKHEIQVLDDSTDGCKEISQKLVKKYQKLGYNITFHHRTNRKDFKAGALNEGIKRTNSQFLAIFDTDFIPPKDFLIRTIPYFLMDNKICLTQARWGHLNPNESFLTKALSVSIDGHFIIEQSARCWGNMFLNFNGTAGVWRKKAIDEAGGWQGCTLTEDMDLSYRAQLKGWKAKFLYDVIVPAEIPADINSLKVQQYRWAKGSIQTAIKLLPSVLKSEYPKRIKLQALLHMTHYLIHPLIILTALFSAPLLAFYPISLSNAQLIPILALIGTSSLAPFIMYLISQKTFYKDWLKRSLILPFLIAIGVGIAVNNSFAVGSALLGKKGEFVRTPKAGDKINNNYKSKISYKVFLEAFAFIYCLCSFILYLQASKFSISPFLMIYSIAFLVVFILSFCHHFQQPK